MSLWGPLHDRYADERPRKILALDGGGIRGILTLEILKEIESVLRERTGQPDLVLCDWYDYVGGTSTGAIIAAGLARGMSVDELLGFYEQSGKEMFDKRSIFHRWKSLYEDGPLQRQLRATFGKDTTLEPEHLRCLLLAVTRNTTTDSPWPISSNPLAKYNHPDRPDCNLRIPLWQLVRASTAAPIFFPPERVEWDPSDDDKTFVFVDGGITPYNNPAFLLYRMATEPAYRLGWASGESQLLITSVGTGAAPNVQDNVDDPEKNLVSNLAGLPGDLMYACSVDQDTNCRTTGRCVHGDRLDGEIGDLIPHREHPDGTTQTIPLSEDLGRAFLYARYNAELTEEGLGALGVTGIDPEQVAQLDAVDAMDDLRRIGRAVAANVDASHFGTFLD
ncbi:MAG: patatin-like phospholipase family protein [Ilumatobacter sp.]|uniref:patatin-like phospholipase family protein n=1 Tax=Ilumatobacter sp. TaxID=1967498 RepID=UPI0026257D27|nr:patatin-like phospholipase family protein [Ilumatobacter sp.]MDJ0769400.1 patatin-like phospholipase family protein [Ilumatobacter sp.]